ncbi:ankyrin repeat-containing protein BDA1-like [Papaver somniferum]|uniref:ankyrin repeat-containing protein BDA1-like n=1 Tax=Papaver somniferum TaxID=3469 RepID=UPI000E703C9D|nr:ankyrin repeat-containing protein BDA1-like [Papaver somniferum]
MSTGLNEIAVTGDVDALMALLKEDPVILTRLITGFYGDPIHVAVICGHVNFVTRVLSIKPELAYETDSAQCSTLLHLASAGNNAEMVNVLLKVAADACKATDRNGNTPIQVATMKGRAKIMQLLIDACPETIQVLTSRKETLLHLCVKYNRLEALRLLVSLFPRDDNNNNPEFVSVNSSDDKGNTILHFAVAVKQTEMIRYLLRKRDNLPEQERDNLMTIVGAINNINDNGFTALDTLMQNPVIDFKDVEIGDLLRNAMWFTKQRATSSSTTYSLASRLRCASGCSENCNDWLTRQQNVLMVVASLIATMAFEAGLNPPGGIWQDNSVLKDHSGEPKHLAGTSILADNAMHIHFLYMVSNTIGFFASLSIIL